jgi:hypothetical protein
MLGPAAFALVSAGLMAFVTLGRMMAILVFEYHLKSKLGQMSPYLEKKIQQM